LICNKAREQARREKPLQPIGRSPQCDPMGARDHPPYVYRRGIASLRTPNAGLLAITEERVPAKPRRALLPPDSGEMDSGDAGHRWLNRIKVYSENTIFDEYRWQR
jgi:hypothetical protein